MLKCRNNGFTPQSCFIPAFAAMIQPVSSQTAIASAALSRMERASSPAAGAHEVLFQVLL